MLACINTIPRFSRLQAPTDEKAFVYELFSTFRPEFKYIGRTTDVEKRFGEHMRGIRKGVGALVYTFLSGYPVSSLHFNVICVVPAADAALWEGLMILACNTLTLGLNVANVVLPKEDDGLFRQQVLKLVDEKMVPLLAAYCKATGIKKPRGAPKKYVAMHEGFKPFHECGYFITASIIESLSPRLQKNYGVKTLELYNPLGDPDFKQWVEAQKEN